MLYRSFYTEAYWRFEERQRLAAEAAAEQAYLQAVLEEAAPGRRVVVLGCGVGRHALGLAQAGFEVTGLDPSAWAIGEAGRRSAEAGVEVRWAVVDLLKDGLGTLGEFDAALCVHAAGWGSDADQRRLLRRVRRRLAPNGVLILTHANLPWVLQHIDDLIRATVGGVSYTFQQTYNPASGRCQGSLTTVVPGTPERVFRCDRRLYTTAELTTLARDAGFVIDRVDADFRAHEAPGVESRSVQVCARAVAAPPVSLAVASWRTPPEQRLDLRYASDEAAWLDPPPSAIWNEVINSEPNQGAHAVGYYPVNDPYGGERAAPVVSRYFGFTIPHHQVTLGPGVTSLLHDLTGLADGGLIVAPQMIHADVSALALTRGAEVHLVVDTATLDRLVAAIGARRPALVHLDRPILFGGLMALDDLYTLGEAAAQVGATVLVDESPSTYFGPSGSAVTLIQHLDNLVVLRGLTKAYSWGGLRVGFAYCSDGVSARVRELVCPLQVGELAFRAAMRLLEAGDIFEALRARIRVVKPRTAELLRGVGLRVMEGHPDLPWVVVPDAGGEASRMLDRLGIRGLPFVPSPAVQGPYPERLLLFSPISDERMEALRTHLQGALGDVETAWAMTPGPTLPYDPPI